MKSYDFKVRLKDGVSTFTVQGKDKSNARDFLREQLAENYGNQFTILN